MSFHNRLLLNRAVVGGLRSVDVMLLARMSAGAETPAQRAGARVVELGGRLRKTEAAIGYLRVEIPIERLVDLVSTADIAA